MARKDDKARIEKYRQEMAKAHNKRMKEAQEAAKALEERCRLLEEDNRSLLRKTEEDAKTIQGQAKLIEALQDKLALSDEQLGAMKDALDAAHELKGVAALSKAMLDAMLKQPGHEYLASRPLAAIKIGDDES